MSEHCPTCGSAVAVVSGNEGTSHYEPLDELLHALARAHEALDAEHGHTAETWADRVRYFGEPGE